MEALLLVVSLGSRLVAWANTDGRLDMDAIPNGSSLVSRVGDLRNSMAISSNISSSLGSSGFSGSMSVFCLNVAML